MDKDNKMIHFKLIIMAVLWAGGFVSSKVITQQAGPFTISFIRFFIATTVLAVLMIRSHKEFRLTKTLFTDGLIAAFFGVFCYNYFFYAGIKLIAASRGSVIMSTVPIVVCLISYVLLNEKIGFFKLIGIMISILGAWIVISKGHLATVFLEGLGKGEVFILLCVICASVFALYSKKILKVLSPIQAMGFISALGTIFLFVPALMEMSNVATELYSYRFVLNILYLALGPTVIAATFYYEGINVIGTAQASQYMNLMPMFAVVLAFIFLGEQLSMSLISGGLLVTLGLYLTNWKGGERLWKWLS